MASPLTGNYPKRISDNLWVLGSHFFNHYLVIGDSAAALVEMGMSALVDNLIEQLESLGVEPDYLVVTHPHADHLTGMAGLVERYPKSVVVAAKGAREFASHPKAMPAMAFEDSYVAMRLIERGIQPGREAITTIHFPEGNRLKIIDDADTIDLGGVSLCLSLMSGHSPGNLLVEVPEQHALLVSDSLGFHYPGRGFLPLFFSGYPDFLKTLTKLEAKNPLFLGPGHGGPIRGRNNAAEAIEAVRQTAENLYRRIQTEGKRPGKLVADLFREYYVDEFTLYSEENIRNCLQLLVKRVMEEEGKSRL